MEETIGSFICQYKINLTTTFYDRNRQLDVACTQESGTRAQLRDLIQALPNFYDSTAYQNDPAVCAIRTTNRATGTGNIDIKAGKNHTRTALYVILRSGLMVVDVHLTSGNLGRSTAELQEIYDFIQNSHMDHPWVIIGDFNHDPSHFGHGVNIVQGPRHQGGGALDWAMSGNIQSMIAHSLPNYQGSDHAPWYVVIEF